MSISQNTPTAVPAHWLRELAKLPFTPSRTVAAAFSGGADSTALLVSAVQFFGADRVVAVHVNHQLQAAANDFEAHVRSRCAKLGVELHVCQAAVKVAPGQSTEDAARAARYQALARAAQQLGAAKAKPSAPNNEPSAFPVFPVLPVLLAQHADDQVESVLLALTRGAGVAGLAGMAAQFERHGAVFVRPFLHLTSTELRKWLDENALPYVTDPTNADTHFTRNRIRAHLLPALAAHFPQFRTTFARSARHAADAATVLADAAAQDLALCGEPPRLEALQALPKLRQAQALRLWLRSVHLTTPEAAQLQELQKQISACTTRGHQLRIKVGAGYVLRAGEVLQFVRNG